MTRNPGMGAIGVFSLAQIRGIQNAGTSAYQKEKLPRGNLRHGTDTRNFWGSLR